MVIPTGKLIAIGGSEDKGTDLESGHIHRNNLNFFELAILRRIVEEAVGPSSKIEVVTTASTIPFEIGNSYLDAFGKIGCNGYCGPNNGPNCHSCRRLGNNEPRINSEGRIATQGETGLFYCGIFYKIQKLNFRVKHDGFCGPNNGPNCPSCAALLA